MKKLITPLTTKSLSVLKVRDEILLTGVIYTARDQAHKKLVGLIKAGKKMPFPIEGAIIYYCGPTATPKGKAIGSCGPTTSSRMDQFTPILLKEGVKALIGKGQRDKEVKAQIKKNKAVYFIAPAGCGALLATKVVKKKLITFKDLGPEAIYKLEVKDFPLVVAIDSKGKSIYV